MAPADRRVADPAAAFDAEWLAARRWFRSKTRRLASVAVLEVVPLSGATRLVVLAARHADGDEDRYLVPAIEEPDGTLREPLDGDGAWRALLAAMAAGEERAGEAGRFAFHATPALDRLLAKGAGAAVALDERRLDVEQSNTSVQLGDELMLKVYRRLEPGVTPEIEVSAFLTDVGFRWTPPLAGHATWEPADDEPSAAAMLQALVASRGDAWGWVLASLSNPPAGPQEALAATAQIGGITAELHAALASRPDAPGFGIASAGPAELAAWRSAAERGLDQALDMLSGADRERLEAVAGRLRERYAEIEAAPAVRTSRTHGDYHLGQLLRTDTGFMVIDFEGEPARPLAERRRPESPLRDVAGMLRSFDYVVRSAERSGLDGLDVDAWLADARSAFLVAYGGVTPDEEPLLAAFEAEKACYEVRYEANNRPDWAWLPIEALERLAA